MAQTPTQREVRARLETVLAEITGITLVITTEDETLTPSQLPAVRVYAGRADRSRERSLQQRTVTRDWYIVLLIKRVGGADGKSWTKEQKRIEELAAEQYLELIPDHLAKYPNLMLMDDKKPWTGCKRVDEPTDNGLQSVAFGKQNAVYFGVVYELPITISRT